MAELGEYIGTRYFPLSAGFFCLLRVADAFCFVLDVGVSVLMSSDCDLCFLDLASGKALSSSSSFNLTLSSLSEPARDSKLVVLERWLFEWVGCETKMTRVAAEAKTMVMTSELALKCNILY